ncbi:P2X purinoceptor 7 isoform X2 [Pseudorasbora parva]|uniref:P2X purinoceptor 7 isoform X2 n=1 Tax=Pseudorasbora parva TaxID=51549 RepID=UPI00351DB5C4
MTDMDSDSSSYSGSESCLEVEDFSPPDSPESHCEQIDDSAGPMPYQFEPLDTHIHTSESEDEPDEAPIEVISHWCSCGNCSRLSPAENVCCKDITQVDGVACITDHPGFEPVALNPYVLQAVYGTFRQFFGEMTNPTLNSAYRHLAYRNFVRWCWGYLGRHIRVVIPSCAVTRIRQQFPEQNENYIGFLPPPLQ